MTTASERVQAFACGAEEHVATFAAAEQGRDAHACPSPTNLGRLARSTHDAAEAAGSEEQ